MTNSFSFRSSTVRGPGVSNGIKSIGHAAAAFVEHGSIEVICGSMFSGKTEELIRLLRRAQFAKQNIQVFKPRIDNRYSATDVASHNKSLLPSITIDQAAEIYMHLRPETQVVGIDEGQFFDEELVDVAEDLAERGIRVLIAGLDMDWKGEPFHPMPALMAIAESVRKLQAVCVCCGSAASRTQRLVENPDAILVGDHTFYEARCRNCFDPSLAHEAKIESEASHDEDDETAQDPNDQLNPILMAQAAHAARIHSGQMASQMNGHHSSQMHAGRDSGRDSGRHRGRDSVRAPSRDSGLHT